jgi:antitoxin (DNA-binding transcriptional repressor) of toxin-antitoxin stability system
VSKSRRRKRWRLFVQPGAWAGVFFDLSRPLKIAALVQQVKAGEGHIEIDVATARIAELLGLKGPDEPSCLTLAEIMHLTRTGRVVRLVDGTGKPAAPGGEDASLLTMLITARRWWAQLAEGTVNVKTLAQQEGVAALWMIRIVRLRRRRWSRPFSMDTSRRRLGQRADPAGGDPRMLARTASTLPSGRNLTVPSARPKPP